MNFLSPKYEPVRTWLYGIAGTGIGIALLFGWLTNEQAAAITLFAGSVLLVPAAEILRTKTASYRQVAALREPDGTQVAGPAAPGVIETGDVVDVTTAEPTPWAPPDPL
jgi:hypothetical protein